MLEISKNCFGYYRLKQSLVLPVVFFDHWALRIFSTNKNYRSNFIKTLKNINGTLLITHANFFEFAAMTDATQSREVEDFLDELIPNLYIVDTSAAKGFLVGFDEHYPSNELHPHWMTKHLLDLAILNKGILTTKSLATGVINNRSTLDLLFFSYKKEIAEMMNKIRNDPEMLEKAKKYIPSENDPIRNILISGFINRLQRDKVEIFTENDSMDLLHIIAVAPVAQFILIDKKWKNKIEQIKSKLDISFSAKIPKAYSQVGNDIQDFLLDLSQYK